MAAASGVVGTARPRLPCLTGRAGFPRPFSCAEASTNHLARDADQWGPGRYLVILAWVVSG